MFGALGRAAVGDFRGGVAAWPSTPLGGVPLGSPGVWSYVFQSFKNKTFLLPCPALVFHLSTGPLCISVPKNLYPETPFC